MLLFCTQAERRSVTVRKEQGSRSVRLSGFKSMEKKKQLIYYFTAVILLAVTAVSALYPAVSNYLAQTQHKARIEAYSGQTQTLEAKDYQELWNAVYTYNRSLSSTGKSFVKGEPQDGAYQELLNIDGYGMMGYLEIPKIGVTLPIYHGTGEKELTAGAGHLEGSSLPAGGAGTHTVLSSHSGYPAAKLFTDLDKLEIGDTFTLYILDRTLTYKVDRIETVIPSDTSLLAIEEGKDYVTLFTCTPYGVNSHRLLVRGVRVE